ncbi:MAG TPA: 4Fe-4S binding protein [Ramlibacter sp.]|nr:4Fe-4S binding protein [Ramlibacter sp.]
MNAQALHTAVPAAGIARQHLIDPEICIRCNTCEEACPSAAILHDDNNYAVSFDACNGCGRCLDPCPTGAIRSWREVASAYSIDDQLGWSALPAQRVDAAPAAPVAPAAAIPGAPRSSSRPVVNLFKRNAPARATVVANVAATEEGAEGEVRHIVLRMPAGSFPVLEGQSVGIVVPGQDAGGKRHAVRQYSVASARHGESSDPDALALTVRRVPGGLCSNHLCDLAPGVPVEVTGPFGATFLLPDDPAAHLLMVCTGTGIAPFRGFIERRRQAMPAATGRAELFYGARTLPDMPYARALQADALAAEFCFSRAPGHPRAYVQDRLRACASRVAALLRDDRTHLYVCGLKGMEQGVEDALADICASAGLDWAATKAGMRACGRYHVETY